MKKTLLFILMVTLQCTLFLTAQQISKMNVIGSGTLLKKELITNDNRDVNGNLCAGIIILSDIDGLSYDSFNGIVKVNHEPGKDFIFLSSNERVLEIHKSGYRPLQVVLSKYGIVLEGGKVWQLEMTGNIAVKQALVNIIYQPEDAQLYVDDKLFENGSSIQLNMGEHQLKIEKEGYKSIDETIIVDGSRTLWNFSLKEMDILPVQIKSVPDAAKILISNIDKGITNKGLFLYPGKYQLKLWKEGYEDLVSIIEVQEGKENVFEFNLEKSTGVLNIKTSPIDAITLINKESFSSINPIEVAPGIYKIEISRKGFEDYMETITIKKGESIFKDILLTPMKGNLRFNVKPLETKVRLIKEGSLKEQWIGIHFLKDLLVGEYEIRCNSEGYEEKVVQLEIKADETEDLDITMIKATEPINIRIENEIPNEEIKISTTPTYYLGFGGVGIIIKNINNVTKILPGYNLDIGYISSDYLSLIGGITYCAYDEELFGERYDDYITSFYLGFEVHYDRLFGIQLLYGKQDHIMKYGGDTARENDTYYGIGGSLNLYLANVIFLKCSYQYFFPNNFENFQMIGLTLEFSIDSLIKKEVK